MPAKRTPLIVMGRKIGTFTDWDMLDGSDFCVDGFNPIEGVPIAFPSVAILYEEVIAEVYTHGGEVAQRFDLLDIVRDLPRVKKIKGVK